MSNVESKSPEKTQWSSFLLIVTGASRGFGRAVCLALCQELVQGSLRVILIGRSSEGLDETDRQMKLVRQQQQHSDKSSQTLTMEIMKQAMDLSNLNELDKNIDKILSDESLNAASYDHVVFINNAASLGHVGPTLRSPSLQDMQQSVDFNITSALWLTVRIMRHFQPPKTLATTMTKESAFSTTEVTKRMTVVNVSSGVAVQDSPTVAIYSAGKAARHRFHSVVASETKHVTDPNALAIKILNYAPGPMETTMTKPPTPPTKLAAHAPPPWAPLAVTTAR